MVTIVTRSVKGAPLTNQEVDDNFTNLNNGKLELTVTGVASASTITPPSNNLQYNVTALAETAAVAAPSGTPMESARLMLRIKDNGSPRILSWNAIYRAVNVTLPLLTTAGKTLYVGMIYNDADDKWDVIAVTVEV